MDTFTKELIERRAKAIGRACEHVLNYQNECDEIAGVGFRYAYLILRKPKKYLEAFKEGDLRIDPIQLEECLWLNQEVLPGTCALLPAELELIRIHNEESSKWQMENSNCNVISLTKKENSTYT